MAYFFKKHYIESWEFNVDNWKQYVFKTITMAHFKKEPKLKVGNSRSTTRNNMILKQ